MKLFRVRSGIDEEEFDMIIRKETVPDNEAIKGKVVFNDSFQANC